MWHSFFIKKENNVSVLRAKKYPQDGQWEPDDGIVLLKEGVEFTEVSVADFRVEKLSLDLVFHGLYTKYFPQLTEADRKVAQSSWERLRTTLENLPKKQHNFPKMKLLNLPRQKNKQPQSLPSYLEPFQAPPVRELVGTKHILEPETSVFQTEIQPMMDVVVFTHTKSTRPWMGRVKKILTGGKEFKIHWFKRRTKSLVFFGALNSDGTPFTSIMSTSCVMLWNFSDHKTGESFELSQEWFNKIMTMYDDHDQCYDSD